MSKSVRPPLFAELRRRTPATPPETPAVLPPTESPAEAVREGQRIARAIIARAEAQAREITAAAQEQGFEEGRRDALAAAAGEVASAVGALALAAAKLDDLRHRLGAQLAATLPETTVELAGLILRRELALRPDSLVHAVRDAVTTVTPAARIDLRLHPEDLAVVESHRAVLESAVGGAELRIEGSPSIARGGCLIETEALTLGAGIAERLERALALLRGADA